MCENGPITSEDELESKEESEVDTRDAVDSCTSEESALKPRKVIRFNKWFCQRSRIGFTRGKLGCTNVAISNEYFDG